MPVFGHFLRAKHFGYRTDLVCFLPASVIWSVPGMANRHFATLGMFIVDEFSYADTDGNPIDRHDPPQIGGGGTYAIIGSRIWLPGQDVGMIVDKGHDFPADIESSLLAYSPDMWIFRDQPSCKTTRALNSYKGDFREFQYLTPRIRITPRDLAGTPLTRVQVLHFICSPTRALEIMKEVEESEGWNPVTIYEPIPDRCVPEELPALIKVLPHISILSPNAEEAHSLLSMHETPSKPSIESAADRLLELGIGKDNGGTVIIRSGPLGAYVKSSSSPGRWVDAFWSPKDTGKVVDVTGGGNSFLGGLAAGLKFTEDLYEATFYASVSASFIIEQGGLPSLSSDGKWNGDSPQRRLEELKRRHGSTI